MSHEQKHYTTYLCDRCGNTVDAYETNDIKGWAVLRTQDMYANAILRKLKYRMADHTFEMCPDCVAHLQNFWDIPFLTKQQNYCEEIKIEESTRIPSNEARDT